MKYNVIICEIVTLVFAVEHETFRLKYERVTVIRILWRTQEHKKLCN